MASRRKATPTGQNGLENFFHGAQAWHGNNPAGIGETRALRVLRGASPEEEMTHAIEIIHERHALPFLRRRGRRLHTGARVPINRESRRSSHFQPNSRRKLCRDGIRCDAPFVITRIGRKRKDFIKFTGTSSTPAPRRAHDNPAVNNSMAPTSTPRVGALDQPSVR